MGVGAGRILFGRIRAGGAGAGPFLSKGPTVQDEQVLRQEIGLLAHGHLQVATSLVFVGSSFGDEVGPQVRLRPIAIAQAAATKDFFLRPFLINQCGSFCYCSSCSVALWLHAGGIEQSLSSKKYEQEAGNPDTQLGLESHGIEADLTFIRNSFRWRTTGCYAHCQRHLGTQLAHVLWTGV